MGKGFLLAPGQMVLICYWTLKNLPRGGWRKLPRRLVVFGLALPLFLILQCLHWLGFAVDELLFRGYRRVPVRRPVVVSGIPRSGTTHLQRVLAGHEQLTAMRTWECVLAPSIAERYLWGGLGRLCKPLGRLLRRLPSRFLREMETIHSLGLTEPEEDFLALLPVNGCFLLVVCFPEEPALWRLARFDRELPAERRRTLLDFYRRLVQKHLYYHGADRRYLCKNPAFVSWLEGLEATFPDADFVLCRRPAREVLPSQLSSLLPAWRLVNGGSLDEAFERRIVSMLADHYRYLDAFESRCGHCIDVPMHRLTADLEATVTDVLQRLELPLTATYRRVLDREVEKARGYSSGHRYRREAFSLQWAEVANLFEGELAR